jgi:hypothetical protein
MKNYLIVIVLFIPFFCFSQTEEDNVFVRDTINHKEKVKEIINKLKTKNGKKFIYISDYNYVSNDTYIFWKKNGDIKARLISNKKLKKRFKNKKICLNTKDKNLILKLLNNEQNFSFLEEYKSCDSPLSHNYRINICIKDDNFFLNSNCLPSLFKNEKIGFLFSIALDRN